MEREREREREAEKEQMRGREIESERDREKQSESEGQRDRETGRAIPPMFVNLVPTPTHSPASSPDVGGVNGTWAG